MRDEILYLAYGSNLHPARLSSRVLSSRLIGALPLENYQLAFHKKSSDGSGKCFLLESPNSVVFSALYSLDSEEKPKLDEIEGLGKGYKAMSLCVEYLGETRDIFTYQAEQSHIDFSLKPYDWYKELALLGARYLKFPEYYLSLIESVESKTDDKASRAQSNLQLAEKLR